MRRFFEFCLIFSLIVFAVSCGGGKKDNVYDYPDEDLTDADTSDTGITDSDIPGGDDDTGTEEPDNDSDTSDTGITDNDIPGGDDDTDTEEPDNDSDTSDTGITDNDIPEVDDTDTTEPDNDSDTSDTGITDNDIPEVDDHDNNPEATENHKISGIYQAGTNVSGIEAALYECGGTEKIATATTNANGKYSFNADISATKTYCVKANDFASCFKGMSDHVVNISEITNAAYLIDENCSDIRKSETKVRLYAKLGTGTWLGELDYSKLSGIKNGLKLLSSYLNINDPKILSQKIAADVKKTDGREFFKFFNGFKISADRKEVKINTRNANSNEVTLAIEGGSSVVADGFHIVWTAQNKTTSAATRKFRSSDPGEYTIRAKLVAGGDPIMQDEGGDPIMGGNGDDGGDPIMDETGEGGDPIMITEDSSTLLFLLEKLQGTIDVRDMSKDISQYIDNGIYAVIPKNTVITKSNSQPAKELTYSILTAGDASQISKIDFGPDGTTFTGDSIYFVYELGTVFGGDPIMLSATRTASDGTSEVLQSAGGDPIMLAAGGDPIMFSAGGDPIMQIARSAGGDPIMLAAGGDPIMLAAGGDPIMLSAGGDPIMLSSGGDPIMLAAGGDPIMQSAGGDPIMNAAGGDPIMNTAAGDPIMLGTSSSVMIAKSGHFSGFLLNSHSLPVSVSDLIEKWCNTYYYQGYSPLEFVRLGVAQYKPEGEDKDELLSYLTCQRLGELESDLYELINKPVGFQRNLNLIENIYFISEFYNRMLAKSESGEVAAVKNGLELRSAIAALYTATTTYNRSSTLADLFDSSKIPLTYSGSAPADYSSDAQKAMTGLSEINDRYIASKKDLMIFANYITTSSNGPDFSSVSTALSPDKLVCAWFNPDTAPQDCNKVYTINEAGHVALGGTEISVAEANAIFSRFFMPFNSRISDEEKLSLFRTFYLAVRYAGTVFYGGTRVEDLNEKLLKTAYLVFDGINRNRSAVSIVDSFDPAAHTVKVLENGSLETTPYINKLSTLTDMISLNVANPADVEKVLININGYEFDQIRENTRIYYKPKDTLKEKSIALTPGTLAAGLKPLKDLLGSENVDELGNITGKMTVVVNSKISNKTYSTQKTYEFLIYGENEGVDSKPVPSDISVFLFDSDGSPISESQNPGIILNPGNKAFYPDHDGRINITGLAPASYTIDAFADGYYAKSVGVNVPENSNLGVEIRLDEEVTSSAEATLTVKVRINTAKHPEKVYLQIYDENMDLVANESAQFSGSTYEDVEIDINFGRFTLLAVGEEMYNYIEDITVNRENTVKEITVVAKNACGNGIIDSTEECEVAGIETPAAIRCGDIYPASMTPDNMTSCNPATCIYDKQDCGKAAICGDGVIDSPEEGCDTKSKNCSDITGFAGTKGIAPCSSICSDWITAGNCSKTEALCGTLPANALWNDGTGRFTQVYDGENWAPATKSASYGLTKDECVFSCRKGYKWDEAHNICTENPLSLGNICTGAASCFDDTTEGECPAYGEAFFGQDWQYAEAGFCTPKELSTTGTGSEKTVVDSFTHYEWHQTAGSAKTWSNADKYCMQSTYAGKNDWRLPSPAELLTIVDSSTASPALDDHFTVSGYNFWATEDKKNTENAWRVTQSGALMSVAKTTKNYVICVRVSEYAAPANRFETAAETVTDKVSSLMWQKSPSSSKSWREALNYCEEISTGGSFDWRLPNRNELASLVDHTKANGAMSDFPGIAAKAFWTSTTKISEIENAWTVNFESGSIESANKTDTKHVLCVRNGGTCFGDECATPCTFDPCRHIENSTGTCREADGAFSCGCKSGFSWSSGKCIIKTTKYTPCTGLPENAKWNTVFGISQTYDGSRWIPSEIGYFNSNASSEECRFICDTNYNWDPDLNRCVAQSKLTSCSGKKPNSVWNEATKINQTWNGEAWEPSETPVFSESSCSESCCFKCKEHFNWNAANEECDPATRNDVECTGLAEHASWWNDQHTITQTWDDNAGDWYPTTTGTYKSDAGDNGCFFKCNENYEWNQALRKCAPKTEYNVACTGLTDPNAEWNQFSTINQTWNEAEEKYLPSTEGTYSATANPERCYFKCKLNFTWNGNICVADTRQAECTGLKSNASWVNSVITQTWNGSEWLPTTAGHHESDSNEGCAFTCKTNYNWKNGGCQAATKPADCDSSTLPAYAQWWNTGITQTWNGYEWLPTTVGSYNDSADETRCYFRCDDNHNWNTTSRRCEPKTQYTSCTADLDAINAEWNVYNGITQTWDETAGENGDWMPSATATYNETPDPNACRYKCKLNYTWNGESCVADTRQAECTGLKSNASWINGTGIITQTWNGSEWEPRTAGSHAEQSNNSECLYECNENYNWDDIVNSCVAESLEDIPCDPDTLPANAVWYKETTKQIWNGTEYWPTTTGTYRSDWTQSDTENGCFFKCKNAHYNWNPTYRRCDPETRKADCGEAPANAEWNIYHEITQTWEEDGENGGFAPSTERTYNEIPSPNECRFKCKTNYTWNGEICDANTREVKCVKDAPHTTWWNNISILTQRWNGEESEWQPKETTGLYSPTEPAVEGCFYKCEEHYVWDGSSSCEPETQPAVCDNSTLPLNASWWNDDNTFEITQTWNSVYEDWYPTTTGTYKSQYGFGDNGCFFKCNEHYKWTQANLSCQPETQTVPCQINHAHAVANGVTSIVQTWDETAGENGEGGYTPSNIAEFSAIPTQDRCSFKCETNYNWNDEECEAATRKHIPCTSLPPQHAEWLVQEITQTWNGYAWEPSEHASNFGEDPAANACTFKCEERFNWDGSKCVGKTRTNIPCGNLPQGAKWYNVSQIDQTWDGSKWTPELTPQYGDNPSNDHCVYTCADGYYWNASKGICTNPCAEKDPCYNLANSTNTCTASSETDYECGCKAGYFWNGKECKKIVTLGNICTGQTKFYDNDSEISQPSYDILYETDYVYDDFYGQDPQELNSSRKKCTAQNFRKTSGIVFDQNTGLMWQAQPETGKYTWENARNYCDNLKYGDYEDWRLPSPQEFLTIADNSRYNLAVNQSFDNLPTFNSSGGWWTNQKYLSGNNWIYSFKPYDGSLDNPKSTETRNVMCVRGEELPIANFTKETINSKVVVKDSVTGIMWQKEYVENKNWKDALAYCVNSNYAGYDDWRLPNKNELATILNYNKSSQPRTDFPGIPITYNTNNYPQTAYWWSSSTTAENYENAWRVETTHAWISPGDKDLSISGSKNGNVLCVRNYDCVDGSFWNGYACKNPCNGNITCGNKQNSTGECIPTSTTAYTCGCKRGYFWNGSACESPCDSNPCGDGICTAKTATTYSCGCEKGYFWNSNTRTCDNPCNGEVDPCFGKANSNEFCTATSATEYSCGCDEGYVWMNSECVEGWNFEDDNYTSYEPITDISQSNEAYPWLIMTSEENGGIGTHSGNYAMCSSNYNVASTDTTMTITVDVPYGGTVSFYVKGTGENFSDTTPYDTFNFYVDGTADANLKMTSFNANHDSTNNARGWADWTLQSVGLTAGEHSLIFQYTKDFSGDYGYDRFCIDDLLVYSCHSDEFFNGTECVHNPCNNNICGTAANSVCTPKSATNFTCSCSNASDGYFWNGEACVNPCDNNICGTAANSVCTPTSATNFTCSCSNASDGYFWSGEACVNPCDNNICGTAANSVCTPTSATNFTCSCSNASDGYFWSGEACVNPCDNNICGTVAHWNETCIATALNEYECGCDDGYVWMNSRCAEGWSFENNNYTSYEPVTDISQSNETYPWRIMTSEENGGMGAHSGNYAICSSNYHIASSDTTMTISVDVPADGIVSFYLKGTSESGYDKFYFSVDGTEKFQKSGTSGTDWALKSFGLSAGTHTLAFRYTKDDSVDKGTDRYCIDDLAIYSCNSDEFFNGTECVPSPCRSDSCSMNHAVTDSCRPLTESDFECSCDDGYLWNSSSRTCEDPCDPNPCIGIANSTEHCTVLNAAAFRCECVDGYFWHGSQNGGCLDQPLAFGRICTGQDKCYNASGEITCPSAGADFYGQDAQYAANGYCTPASFKVRGTGNEITVYDNNLGLEWQQIIPDQTYSWEEAANYCDTSDYAGETDWRLPTPHELSSIVDYGKSNPATYTDYFTDLGTFWTSKQYMYIMFANGYSSIYSSGSYKVRCVRGTTLPANIFVETTAANGDVIVTDTVTGLIWQKTYVEDITWQDALYYCENLEYAGKTDWRMPNMNELRTLFNYDKSNPPSDFPDMPISFYWWSSTNAGLEGTGTTTRAFNTGGSSATIFIDQITATMNDVKCVRSEN